MMQSSGKNSASLYAEVRDLIDAEARASSAAYEQLMSLPLAARIRAGRCVTGLRFLGELNGGILTFVCDENLSEFREGDRVCLHCGEPGNPLSGATWVGDSIGGAEGDTISLEVSEAGRQAISQTIGLLTLDEGLLDLSAFYRRALEDLAQTERGRERILPLLGSEADSDVFDVESYNEAEARAAIAGFDSSQQEAVALGSSAQWCALIKGPPGTGKTRVLAQVVRERLNAGERVLVTACTNRAIHEALNKIVELNPGFSRIAKVGAGPVDRELRVDSYAGFRDAPFAHEVGPMVIGATPFAARSQRLSGVEFDCVIIDEASQMTLPLAIMAMLVADVYIIIGDDRQLPPVLLSKPVWDAKSYGIFQHLSRTAELVQLSVSYRMNAAICGWVSQAFYLGDLEPHPRNANRVLQLGSAESAPWLNAAIEPERSIVWIPGEERMTQKHSAEEAVAVVQLVVALFRRGVALNEIVVLTPFRRQARLIRKRLQQSPDLDSGESAALVVDTVERMQGQERPVTIISMAASDAGFIGAVESFLFLPARLNVMVSRARSKVIILAADALLEHHSMEPEINEAIAIWRSLREASCVVNMGQHGKDCS